MTDKSVNAGRDRNKGERQTLICIGASAGGTEAVQEVLTALPVTIPPVMVTIHMPSPFSKMYADRLNTLAKINVREAVHGDRLKPGTALISPGDIHTKIVHDGISYKVQLEDGPKVRYVKPSVDVLFTSIAKLGGENVIAVILTGMGDDGARGMAELRALGAYTVAQDEATSLVYGMPKEAVKHGGVCDVAPIYDIPKLICKKLRIPCYG